jgi:hypothetical protein
MLLDFHKLYEPYAKDASLETTMLWLEKEAHNRGIPDDVRNAVIAEVFLEMANGKTFPIDHCDCSPDCPFANHPWSSAAMNHYTLRKMIEANQTVIRARSDLILASVNSRIIQRIEQSNAEFVAEQTKPSRLKRAWEWFKNPGEGSE